MITKSFRSWHRRVYQKWMQNVFPKIRISLFPLWKAQVRSIARLIMSAAYMTWRWIADTIIIKCSLNPYSSLWPNRSHPFCFLSIKNLQSLSNKAVRRVASMAISLMNKVTLISLEPTTNNPIWTASTINNRTSSLKYLSRKSIRLSNRCERVVCLKTNKRVRSLLRHLWK